MKNIKTIRSRHCSRCFKLIAGRFADHTSCYETRPVNVRKSESVEDFLARGGTITKLPALSEAQEEGRDLRQTGAFYLKLLGVYAGFLPTVEILGMGETVSETEE